MSIWPEAVAQGGFVQARLSRRTLVYRDVMGAFRKELVYAGPPPGPLRRQRRTLQDALRDTIAAERILEGPGGDAYGLKLREHADTSLGFATVHARVMPPLRVRFNVLPVDGVPLVKVESATPGRDGHHREYLDFKVPDHVPDAGPATPAAGWDMADRNRFLAWAGFEPA